jgi:hypothetical protein
MLRALLPVLTIVLLLMVAPASAIPICPPGTMADYLSFGSVGCQFNTLTFSNFSYSGIAKDFTGPNILPAPPSVITVEPFTAPGSLGAGGAGLEFTSPPSPTSPPLSPGGFHLVHWGSVSIGFDVAATGHGIVGNVLSGQLQSIANLQSASLGMSAVPGGTLAISQGVICFNNPFGPPPPSTCANPAVLSFAETDGQAVSIGGTNIESIEAGFATPEPATLLLVGTGAAGVGLAGWVKRRRSRDREHAA